jgi:hypothetical protein
VLKNVSSGYGKIEKVRGILGGEAAQNTLKSSYPEFTLQMNIGSDPEIKIMI